MIHMPPVTKITTGGAAAPAEAAVPWPSEQLASDGAPPAVAASTGLLSGRYRSSVFRGAAPYMMLRFTALWGVCQYRRVSTPGAQDTHKAQGKGGHRSAHLVCW